MKDAPSIKHFFFGNASYHVSDGMGDEVVLKVNYKDNSFLIQSIGHEENRKFRRELRVFAEGLLSRKHNTDFANR